MANSFGKIFRITTFGESHGGAVGVTIDGCPAGHSIDLKLVQAWLERRRPGQSHLASPRAELDIVECLSGLEHGKTLGTPLSLIVRNKDAKADHYQDLTQVYRPSHADYTTEAKWGIRPSSGGGRASARETIGRVAAAAIAEQILNQLCPELKVVSWVDSIRNHNTQITDPLAVTRHQVDSTALRCPDPVNGPLLEQEIIKAKKAGDSVGGTIATYVTGCPVGLGEPVFEKLEALLAQAMLSLPACKGFEVGSGFAGTQLYGSEHNDAFVMEEGQVRTSSNRSGGIQGGISNGEPIYFKAAFKPVATIFKNQASVTNTGETVTMKPKQGRHDPCVLPRAVPIVEAMTTLVLMDCYLRQQLVIASGGRA